MPKPLGEPPIRTPIVNDAGTVDFTWAAFFLAIQQWILQLARQIAVIFGTGSAGQVLTSNGPGLDPTFQSLPASGMSPVYTAQTSAYNAVANDFVSCTSGTFTVTLPAAAANLNKAIWVVNNGSGSITVGRTGADTVGLATSQTLNTGGAGRQGDEMTFISDGISNWNIT